MLYNKKIKKIIDFQETLHRQFVHFAFEALFALLRLILPSNLIRLLSESMIKYSEHAT